MRKHLGISFKEIGRHFGDRDHTTVMYACKRIGLGLEQGEFLIEDIRAIERALCLDVVLGS
jgi:chromosomal replication initiator protein